MRAAGSVVDDAGGVQSGSAGREHSTGLSRRVASRRGAAFSLIELILVLALIAALSALVLPSMPSRLGGAKMDAMADAVARAVQEASAYSVGSGKACELVLRASADGDELVRRDVESKGDVSRDVVLLGLGRDFELIVAAMDDGGAVDPPGLGPGPEQFADEDEAGTPLVIFLPDGTAVAAAVRWRLSSGTERRVLTLQTGSARVSVGAETASSEGAGNEIAGRAEEPR